MLIRSMNAELETYGWLKNINEVRLDNSMVGQDALRLSSLTRNFLSSSNCPFCTRTFTRCCKLGNLYFLIFECVERQVFSFYICSFRFFWWTQEAIKMQTWKCIFLYWTRTQDCDFRNQSSAGRALQDFFLSKTQASMLTTRNSCFYQLFYSWFHVQ